MSRLALRRGWGGGGGRLGERGEPQAGEPGRVKGSRPRRMGGDRLRGGRKVAWPPVSLSLFCRSSLPGYVDRCSGSQNGHVPPCPSLAFGWLFERLETFARR